VKNLRILFLLTILVLSLSFAQTNNVAAPPAAGNVTPASPYNEKVFEKIKELREILAANPQDGNNRFILTQFLFHVKMYKETLIEGNATLNFISDNPSLYYMLGESYRQLGQTQEALKVLEIGYHLKDKTITAGLATSYGMTLLRLNMLPEATAVFTRLA
jgi:tetratricopeptide (TPR) repeat protein